MRNKYPGTCYKCNKYIAKGEGHFERVKRNLNNGNKWRTQCATCAIENKRRIKWEKQLLQNKMEKEGKL